MSARTPQQAVHEFFEPLQQALGCIGDAKITTSPGGKGVPDRSHSWTINNDDGVKISNRVVLVARMRYRIVKTDDGKWRVTTDAYQYAYRADQSEIISWHWHPSGNSHYVLPHLHVGMAVPVDDGVLTPNSHLRTARTAFEEVVGIGISELEIEPRQVDWQDRLNGCLEIFELNRTWSETPDQRAARPWS